MGTSEALSGERTRLRHPSQQTAWQGGQRCGLRSASIHQPCHRGQASLMFPHDSTQLTKLRVLLLLFSH